MSREKQSLCSTKHFLVSVALMYAVGTSWSMAQSQKASLDGVLQASQQQVFHGQGTVAGKAVGGFLRDAVLLQTKLFDWDTFKIFVGMFPLFIGARMVDEPIHHCFYTREHHKNIHQMHNVCYEIAKNSLAIPIVFFGSGIFWAKNEEFRETSRVFLIGMPFVIWSKEIIKKWHVDCCKRPWNEKFSSKKQAYGGFPSGHMAEIVYSAVLFGKRLGPRAAIPLGILSAFLGITFINCNRHYLSQIVAGAGLGTMYALAADKLISSNLERRHPIDVGVGLNEYGKPELQVGVSF